MRINPLVLPHESYSEDHDPKPPNEHPSKQYPKIHSKMTLRSKYDGPNALNRVVEREAVAVQIEAWHQHRRSKCSRDIDDEPYQDRTRHVSRACMYRSKECGL